MSIVPPEPRQLGKKPKRPVQEKRRSLKITSRNEFDAPRFRSLEVGNYQQKSLRQQLIVQEEIRDSSFTQKRRQSEHPCLTEAINKMEKHSKIARIVRDILVASSAAETPQHYGSPQVLNIPKIRSEYRTRSSLVTSKMSASRSSYCFD